MHSLTSLLALALAQIVISQQPVTPDEPFFSEEPIFSEEPLISEQPECPVVLPLPSGLTQHVIGGQSVQHDDLLFHAWLLRPGPPESIALCSAARISKHWVLTAAHCDVKQWWSVSLSSASVREPAVAARIERVYNHPNYTGQVPDMFDYALLRIVPEASERDEVHVLRMNSAPWLPVEGAFVRVSGYGIRSFEIEESNALHPFPENVGDLHFVDIPVFPFSSCSQAYFGLVSEGYHLCSGYEHNPCNQCSGDSGGPVFQYDRKGRPVQVGIHTSSIGCAEPGFPGIGVRVDAVLPWFKEVGAVFETGEPEQVFRQSNTAEDSDTLRPTRAPEDSDTQRPTSAPEAVAEEGDVAQGEAPQGETAQGNVPQPAASTPPVVGSVDDSDVGVTTLDVQQPRAAAGSQWALVAIAVGSAFGVLACVGGWALVAKKKTNTRTPQALPT